MAVNMTINELRAKTGLSQSQFAARFDLSLDSLKQWERGRFKTPGHVTSLIARILELEEKKVVFRNEQHEKDFYRFLQEMKHDDCYHSAVAYLLSLDVVLVDHAEDVFSFAEDAVLFDTALQHGWQTGTSYKTTRLLMNLWNGWCCDFDDEGEESSSPAFAVSEIFCCEYAPYYWEAIKLRYPEYCN